VGVALFAALSFYATPVGAGPARARARVPRIRAVPFVRSGGGWVAHGSGYVLSVDQSGLATLSAARRPFTSFPLAAAGEGASLAGASVAVTARAGDLRVTESLGGSVASLVDVRALAGGILVRTSIGATVQGAGKARAVDFLSDGSRGLSLAGELGGWTPQGGTDVAPRDEYMALPFVSGTATTIAGRTWNAFGPPPLDVGLHFAAGWLGIGLVQIPNANVMSITTSGGVRINYPVATLAGIADAGNGGTHGGLIRFPELAITFGHDPYSALASYGRLVTRLDGSRRSSRPRWWRRPLVDTFGQQDLDGVTNGKNPSGFTAAYVRRFAHSYQRRFGVHNATLVIDATWQKDPGPLRQVGDPEPGPLFGGYTGMRRLIDSLHHSGFRVLLWWQSWLALPGSYADRMGVVDGGCRTAQCPPGSRYGTIDPTSPGFPTYVRAVTRRLLGSGRGDLNADGLKMDFTFLVPSPGGFPWSNPSLGIGLAASHRYFATFLRDAHQVKRSALLTASIAAPQFADAIDEIRLDDSETVRKDSSEAKWQARARIASAVQAQTPIDSDGWVTDAHAAIEHFLTAGVYGVPELDYISKWQNGPLRATEARLIGQIQTLAATRPTGSPLYVSPGHWLSLHADTVVAETLRSARGGKRLTGLDVWSNKRIRVLATMGTRIAVPLHGATVRSVTAHRPRIRWHVDGPRLVLRLRRDEKATILLGRSARPCRTASRCSRGW
jgi:hypothetical protein